MAIKKLPQVGQEPVEAVESRHSSPDAPMIRARREKSKEIPEKIAQYSSRSRLEQTPILRHPDSQFGGYSLGMPDGDDSRVVVETAA